MSTATDAPPSYESYRQAMDEVTKIIENLPIEAKTKVYEKMQEELNKSEKQTELVEEVEALANEASNIGKLFQSVTLKLESADKKEYPGVEDLAPGWRALHKVSLNRPKCVCMDSSDHNFNRCARDTTNFLRSRKRRPQTPTIT
jgi:hypothetical protein